MGVWHRPEDGIPFKFKRMNTCKIEMSDKWTSEKFVRVTTGGTSAAVASKSQITPFQSVSMDCVEND